MARNRYSAGKRQRENEKARKKREKQDRRKQNRESGGGIPIASVEDIQGGSMASAEGVMEALESGSPGPVRASGIPCRLFVGGLSWGTTAQQLQNEFARFGSVAESVIVTDRDTGDSRGFGFVTMADRRDATKAMSELNGQEFEGRTWVVKPATERGR